MRTISLICSAALAFVLVHFTVGPAGLWKAGEWEGELRDLGWVAGTSMQL